MSEAVAKFIVKVMIDVALWSIGTTALTFAFGCPWHTMALATVGIVFVLSSTKAWPED